MKTKKLTPNQLLKIDIQNLERRLDREQIDNDFNYNKLMKDYLAFAKQIAINLSKKTGNSFEQFEQVC